MTWWCFKVFGDSDTSQEFVEMRFYRGKREFLYAPRRRMYRFLWALPALWFVYLFFAGESGYLQIRERARQIRGHAR